MGRVIRQEVVALRCELRRCANRLTIGPLPLYGAREREEVTLQLAVDLGWSLVLTPQLRSYCPEHAHRVDQCTCRTNPERSHLCVQHEPEVRRLVRAAWVHNMPEVVAGKPAALVPLIERRAA